MSGRESASSSIVPELAPHSTPTVLSTTGTSNARAARATATAFNIISFTGWEPTARTRSGW